MRKTITALSILLHFFVWADGQNIQLRAHLPYSPVNLANIGGYVDSAGREYALVGESNGLAIVDVTNPDSLLPLFQVPGVNSIWREVKTWQHYAYVTNENGNGLQILNLAYLPDSIQITQWHGDSTIAGNLQTCHALHIDNGYLYLYGCGNGTSRLFHGAAIICDLHADPWNPHYLGHTTDLGTTFASYVHDGYVYHDTLWAGHINSGQLMVWDCADKANPVLLASLTTPGQFTHNTWLSDDKQTLFTTDEVSDSYLTAYDVSDLGNITELSRFQTAPGSNATVHNTHILNDYAVTSWYTEGVVITDVSRPQNPIEVGKYDTYAAGGGGQNGCWGVYPYLPSGNLVVSDIQNGLFVLTPTYVRGCYLEGIVRDSVTNFPLQNVNVSINAMATNKSTDIDGAYKTGTADSGTYTVTFSVNGYYPLTVPGVVLTNGVLTSLDVKLLSLQNFTFSGVVADSATGQPLASAELWIQNGMFEYYAQSDTDGFFSIPGFYDGTYDVTIGKWGYQSSCQVQFIPLNAPADTLRLAKGYYDDFTFDFGWSSIGTSLNPWQRVVPLGTTYLSLPANPGADDQTDCKNFCYVTGNAAGSPLAHDVDTGVAILISPEFDPTYLVNPVLYYSRWFVDRGITTANDSMIIYLDNGVAEVPVEVMCPTCSAGNGTWFPVSIPINAYLAPTATMKLKAVIRDVGADHVLEGGFDYFRITGSLASGLTDTEVLFSNLVVFPNPSSGQVNIRYSIPGKEDKATLFLRDVTGRVLLQKELNGNEGVFVTGEQLVAGMYFVSVDCIGLQSRQVSFVISK